MNRRLFLGLLISSPATAEWRRDNREQCARIDERLKDNETKRRAGYTAKQGRRLREQRDKLERTRRQRCR